ncbi:elongation factor 1-beta [Candidatus Bathyarchaeota archaeon]|nr:MAG: elongation factor 1-beta [Candidatus Hecatellales archaeon]RLI34701.1 MAG: elongation factor 1-beta [Candidatus Bathyarchaeota archaeon]
MGEVVASIKLLPAEADLDLEKIKEAVVRSLPEGARIHRFDEEPIAFGLKALIAHVVMPETEEGFMEKVEEAVRKAEGVGEVEVLMVRRF